MDHLSVLQSKGILKNANSYILTNKEKKELIDSFYNLAKINKIDLPKKPNFNPHTIGLVSKNLTLKDMINLSLTDKKMRETMTPIIENKKNELRELTAWLSNLPEESQNYTIEQLDQLTELHLNDYNLTKIPTFNLPNLQLISFDNNQLTSIPSLNFPNLKELRLRNNRFKKFPIMNFPKLESLWLNDNQLTSIPSLNLPNLKEFLIHRNKLKTIYNLNLPNLENLSLSENNLTNISNLNLPKLKILQLSSNQLIELPTLSLNLEYLDLKNNPLPETEKERLKYIYGDKVKL